MRIPDERIEGLIDATPVGRLSTLGLEGRPHLVPIVFARSAGDLWSPIDGKPKSEAVLARIHNLRRDSRVSLLLDHYDADWSRLWWLRLDGTAQPIVGDARDPEPRVSAALRALEAKYPQYATTPVLRGRPTVIRIRITRTVGWCASQAALETGSAESSRALP